MGFWFHTVEPLWFASDSDSIGDSVEVVAVTAPAGDQPQILAAADRLPNPGTRRYSVHIRVPLTAAALRQ